MSATVYLAHCPRWCMGKHAMLLAMADAFTVTDDEAPDLGNETAEVIFHQRPILTDAATGLDVDIVQAEPFPGHPIQPTPPFLELWLSGDPVHPNGDEPLYTPGDLRRLARALNEAADKAEKVIPW